MLEEERVSPPASQLTYSPTCKVVGGSVTNPVEGITTICSCSSREGDYFCTLRRRSWETLPVPKAIIAEEELEEKGA